MALCESDIVLKVALLPTDSAAPLEAVKRQLNGMLFRFCEELGGIPLTYSSLRFPKNKDYGRIHGEHYWIHVDVVTTLLVFKPKMSHQLTGKAVKVRDMDLERRQLNANAPPHRHHHHYHQHHHHLIDPTFSSPGYG